MTFQEKMNENVTFSHYPCYVMPYTLLIFNGFVLEI